MWDQWQQQLQGVAADSVSNAGSKVANGDFPDLHKCTVC